MMRTAPPLVPMYGQIIALAAANAEAKEAKVTRRPPRPSETKPKKALDMRRIVDGESAISVVTDNPNQWWTAADVSAQLERDGITLSPVSCGQYLARAVRENKLERRRVGNPLYRAKR